MASLKNRGGIYHIVFSKRVEGRLIQRVFSLDTSDRKKAERLKMDFEMQVDEREIDPFSGWSPRQHFKEQEALLAQKHMNLDQACTKFIEERTQANAVTKLNYRKHFSRMMDHLGKTMPLSKLRSQDIRDLCFRPDISVATQRSYFTHYRVFFKWLFDNKYIAEDLVKGIKPPKQIDRLVDKVIDEQGLKRLFETFDAHIAKNVAAGFIVKDIQKMLWFKPVISTFFYAGLRSKELIHLKWKDIDADFRFIRVVNSKDVTTKSGKMRSIPIRKPLIPYLKEWKAMCDASPDNYVFTNPKALVKGQKMDPIKITHTFKRFARMANLPKDCNVHGLRHSFGTEILKKGIPINEVALMMGHSSIEVTKIYQHLTPDDLYENVRNIDR